MNTTKTILACTLAMLGGIAGNAQARYLCDAPPTPLDARACAAAQKGPAALRQFIQRVQSIQNLQFSDYVDEATDVAWAAQKSRRPAEAADTLAARRATREQR
jgi:hypothetical protein